MDAWPTSVGAINVAFDSNDALEEFDVEFQYQYLDASKPDINVKGGSEIQNTEVIDYLSSQVG